MTIKGTLFGKLRADTKTRAVYDGKVREGWICTCGCGNRTFKTEEELARLYRPHCGCECRETPLPDRCFTKESMPKWESVEPIRSRDEAIGRIGEVWGTQTIVGVRVNRIEVVCSACHRVKQMSFRNWGRFPCTCGAFRMISSNGKFVGMKFGKLTIESFALTASAVAWRFHVKCDCGSRFTQSVTRTRSMVEHPNDIHQCAACVIEQNGSKNLPFARKWRKRHGGVPLQSARPSYLIGGAKYETTVVSKTAKEKRAPNFAPKGLIGSEIPRHMLSQIWERFQASDDVCSAWRDKEKFIFWARTSGYVLGAELVRIDEDKPFHPSNVKWIADRSAPSNSKYRPINLKKVLKLC